MKKIISLTLILLLIVAALPMVPTFADETPDGYYTSIDTMFALDLKPNDLKGLKDVLKDFYLYKGTDGDLEETLTEDAKAALIEAGLEETIDELRDANTQIQSILVANGLTKAKSKSIVLNLLNAFEDASSLTDMVGVLQDLKSDYAEIIVNIKNNITQKDIPFVEKEDLKYTVPTYFYYLGALAQDKKMIVYDENNPDELTVDIASRYSNNTSVETEIPDGAGGFQESYLNDYLMISLMNGQITEANFSVNSLKGPLETSLQSQIDGYLSWEDASYTASELAVYAEALGILETIPLDEDDDEDDDDNNGNNGDPGGNAGGGGGGFIPPTPGPNVVTDRYETRINEELEISIDDLLSNDRNAENFVSAEDVDFGSIEVLDDVILYTPPIGEFGQAMFRYTVEDADGNTDDGLVIIIVRNELVIEDGQVVLGAGEDVLTVINPELEPLGMINFDGPYIFGYPDGTFKPEKLVTRAEMAVIFTRILGLETESKEAQLYTDVEADDWYYDAIQAVSEIRLFNGYPDGTFKPEASISHAEIATTFSRYWLLNNISVGIGDPGYLDTEGHWAELHINRMFSGGVTVQFPDGTFRPDQKTTRTELVIMVNRLINRGNYVSDAPVFSDVTEDYYGIGAIEAATQDLKE